MGDSRLEGPAGAAGRTPAIVDVTDVRFRLRSITVGVRLTCAIAAAGAVYTLLTWSAPHRVLILAVCLAAVLVSVGVARAPRERIVRSPRQQWFFLAWSAFMVAGLAIASIADGGGRTPLALGFFLPLIFAALAYPLRSVVVVAVLDVAACVAVLVTVGRPESGYASFFACCLAITAVMCAWQARNHERQREELAIVSRADPLTGCLNRRGFEERLEAELASAARLGRPVTIVLVDLDNFKDVNDTRGHAAGDELLRRVAAEMRRPLRPMDVVGRLGGDEYALLLPGADEAEALGVLGRLQDALSGQIGATGGTASFPVDGLDREELYRRADRTLYAAKHGRSTPRAMAGRDLSWAAALAHAVDRRMAVEHSHSSAVATYAVAIAERLGWDRRQLGHLRMAAMLHDVGKVAVPDRILRKPEPLTPEELTALAQHPAIGAEIVARVDGLRPLVRWIRHSHERMDGDGYPDGLCGNAVPVASRILLVADAYDAMTSDRPYRPALTRKQAVAELERHAGTQFDPDCVAALVAHLGVHAPA